MTLEDFIDAEDVDINGNTYRISCIPALDATEILPSVIDSIKKNDILGDITLPVETTMKIMKWSAKKLDDGHIILDSPKRINTYVPYKDLLELQVRIIKKNFDFLDNGGLQKILGLPPTSEPKQ